MSARPGVPVGVHVLFARDDGTVLLMRRAGTGFFDGLYILPGGHLEPGESIVETACRESLEELGVVVEPGGLIHQGVVHRLSDTNRIDFFVLATRWRNTPRIMEPDKCDDLVWCMRAALPDNTVPYIRAALARTDTPWIMECGWAAGTGG